MKNFLQILSLIIGLLISIGYAGAQVTVAGSTGANGSFTSLTNASGAFAAINGAGSQTGNNITITITADIAAEAGTFSLNANNWTSLSIIPSGARSVSGSVAAAMITLNGADNVTIDGLNASGNSLTISNTSTSATTGTCTIRFIGGATNNTVTRCSVRGSSTMPLGTNGGTIYFGTDGTTANGNDNNTISLCDIGPAGANLPTKAIYGNGTTTTAAIRNSGILINNNNIFDFFNATTSVSGVHILSGNDSWTISNNRIYQTASRTFTSTAMRYAGITINSNAGTLGSFTISSNTIGFGTSGGTGTTTISGSSNEFRGIDVISCSSTSFCSIQGNTISGINQTSSRAATTNLEQSCFIAISTGTSAIDAPANIGDMAGNIIGSLDGSSSITINATSTTASTIAVIGILDYNFLTGISISNNQIGSLTINNGGSGTTVGFRGILVSSTSGVTRTINNNIIGGTASGSITDNIVGNYAMYGIQISGAPNSTITGNTIRNFSGNANGAVVTMSGIVVNTGSTGVNTVSQNTVHSLSNVSSGANVGAIYGLDLTFPVTSNIVERNTVHSLSVSSTATSYQIFGIIARTLGTGTYKNNMVRLGLKADGSSITSGFFIVGIRDAAGATTANNFYNNSVYIGGTGVVSVSNTYAFLSDVVTNTRSFQDNIFYNGRSNASGGVANIAIRVGGTVSNPPGLTSNYNVLVANGTDGAVGVFNGSIVATFANWQTTTGQDANSYNTDPQFIAPNGTAATGDLRINTSTPTVVESSGLAIAGVTDDIDGQTRASFTPTDIGADAGNFLSSLNEIDINGNATSIVDGDITPSATDFTDFGSISVCAGTILKSYTIFNTGTVNLTVSNPVITGANAADFSVTANPSATIAPATSSTFQITFNPSASGTRSATITVNNNDGSESVYDFAIQGTGIDPEINVQGNAVSIVDGDVTPSAADFTDFGTSVFSKLFTIQNTGNSVLNISSIALSGGDAGLFSISGAPASVAAGSSATFTVNYAPTVAGIHSTTVIITNNDCDEATYDYAITATSVMGAALNFDGANDIVMVTETPALLGLGPVGATLEAWVKPTSVAGVNSIIRKTGDYNLYLNGNVVGAEIWPAGEGTGIVKIISGTTAIAAGVYTHIAFTWDPITATGKLYVNGVLDPSSSFSINVPGDDQLTLGTSTTYGQTFFGDMDEVRIWNFPQCVAQIVAQKNCELAGTETGLLAYYQFNTGIASFNNAGITTLTDIAGANNSGTLTNFALTSATSNWISPGAVLSGAGCASYLDPEINVQGNATDIVDGDVTPNAGDFTNVGSVLTCTGSISQTFIIQNIGTGNLILSTPTLTGANAADFSITSVPSSPVAAGGSTTFQVTFNPSANGVRTATINISNNDCDESTYDFSIQGTGNADITPPTITCAGSISVNSDAGVCTYASSQLTAPATSDNCGVASVTASPSSLVLGPNTVTWTVTDNVGLTNTCTQTVTVLDVTPPTLSGVPADQTVQCDAGVAPAVTAADICDPGPITVVLTENIVPGSCPNSYVLTRTWTATDIYGNSSSQSQISTVIDNTPPTLVGVPSDQTVQCDAGVAPTVTATDNCDPGPISVTMTETILPGSCPNSYTLTRTWTATDICGNTSSQSQISTVIDNTPPTLVGVPSDQTIQCDAGVAPTVTAIDNCDPGPISVTMTETILPGSCPNSYTLTRTWTATDICGNSSSQSQISTVIDNTPPTLVGVPSDQTIQCDAGVAPTVTAIDNCDPGPISVTMTETILPGSCPNSYTLTRTWTATDICGNSSSQSQISTVIDNTPPTLVGVPSDQTIQCDAGVAPTVTAIDNCDPGPISVTMIETILPGSCPNSYTLTRTWTATDICGNTSSQSQTINVQDITAPVIGSPGVNGTITCPAVPIFTAPTATDACGTATVNVVSDITTPGCGGSYSRTITWDAVDDCGNTSSTVSQTINVQDVSAPTITCGAPVTVVAFCGTANVNLTAPVTSDGCSSVSVSSNHPGTFYTLGTTTVTWTATDACGNTSTCTQTVTVTSPEIDITGNAISITDGSTTYSTLNFTDFGNVPVCLSTVTKTYIIKNLGTATLNLTGTPRIVLSGANAADYVVTTQPTLSSIGPGQQTTFSVRFDPSVAGLRFATVTIQNSDCNEAVYDFAIRGNGRLCAEPEGNTTNDSLPVTQIDHSTTNTADGSSTSNTTSIENEDVFEGRIYPNPSNGIFILELNKMPVEHAEIKVMDALGQVIYSNKIINQSMYYDFSYLRAATYYISVISNEGTFTKKIMITHAY